MTGEDFLVMRRGLDRQDYDYRILRRGSSQDGECGRALARLISDLESDDPKVRGRATRKVTEYGLAGYVEIARTRRADLGRFSDLVESTGGVGRRGRFASL